MGVGTGATGVHERAISMPFDVMRTLEQRWNGSGSGGGAERIVTLGRHVSSFDVHGCPPASITGYQVVEFAVRFFQTLTCLTVKGRPWSPFCEDARVGRLAFPVGLLRFEASHVD